jgi:hypothetical protein
LTELIGTWAHFFTTNGLENIWATIEAKHFRYIRQRRTIPTYDSPSGITSDKGLLGSYSIVSVLLRFLIARKTSIATGFITPPILASGDPVDADVGPGALEPAGARGSDVHTNSLIHYPVIADKRVGMAVGSVGVGQYDFCAGR